MGPSQRQPRQRVFGGQVLAQSLVAGMRTVDPDRSVHSMHGYFLRPGDANKPITFGVQRLRDGRSFSARRVHAYQEGVPILSMIASFQAGDEGIEHQSEMPAGIPDPESLPSTADLLGKFDHPVARHWAYERPFDIRHVDPALYVSADGPQGGAQRRVDEDLRPHAGRRRTCTAPPWPTPATTPCSNPSSASTG